MFLMVMDAFYNMRIGFWLRNSALVVISSTQNKKKNKIDNPSPFGPSSATEKYFLRVLQTQENVKYARKAAANR